MLSGQVVALAVESEGAAGDAVGVAAGDAPEVGVRLHVVVEVVEAERDVGHVAVAVGHLDRLDDAAVGDDLDDHAPGVGERVEVDGLALDLAERFAGDARAPRRGGAGVRRRLLRRHRGGTQRQGHHRQHQRDPEPHIRTTPRPRSGKDAHRASSSRVSTASPRGRRTPARRGGARGREDVARRGAARGGASGTGGSKA